ncbi:hypothetical protein [Streptomyces sp. NPDC052114]|uniref:alpha/beta hydrolase family protein n=1 Tax=unclassified Streptomyces TaxID=2593676 RepID=UPI0034310398
MRQLWCWRWSRSPPCCRARRRPRTPPSAPAPLSQSPPSLAQSPPPPSGSDDAGLPKGWRLHGEGVGQELVWTSREPVPVGDARIEFHSGDRLLGAPVATQDRRSFRLPLRGARVGPAKELKVLAAGRRLDEAGVREEARRPRPAVPARPATPPPANEVDPGEPGPYRTVTGAYTLPSVRLPGFAEPVEMRAQVVGPADAPGKRPVALFLHGRHSTCYGGPPRDTSWPCGPGKKPLPSHEGFRYAQQLLASQGYVTVSVSANGINGQDEFVGDAVGEQARSSLVRLHLGRWADWARKRSAAPAAVRAVAPADLSRVLLVGHSRGGEGINQAALDSLYPPPSDVDGYHGAVRWRIRGTVHIGPTSFGRNPVADVPSVTILPGCDGDVSDLAGQYYVDGTRGVSRGAALHSAVYMVGANHNFFNSEWTPGQATAPAEDDFSPPSDPVCSKGTRTRLTVEQQQAAGATYLATAARLFVAGDDRARPLLDGSRRRAPSAGLAQVLTSAVGAHRTAALVPDGSTRVEGGRLCAQERPGDARACLPTTTPWTSGSPHFSRWWVSPETGRQAVAMDWSRPGDPVRMSPARPFSLAGAEDLALRVFVPPNTTGTELDVSLVDTAGHRAALGRVRVDGLPGSDRTASFWAQEVRVPLSAAARQRLDLGRVSTVELTPRTRSGKAWLMDAWGWRPGTPEVRPAALPRVDIGRLTVEEGDSGVRTYRVPVRVSGQGSGTVRLFVQKPGTDEATHRTVTVRPGGDVDVPVEVRGDTRFGYDIEHHLLAKPVHGAVVGSFRGGVTVQDDDPMPDVTLEPVAGRVAWGEPLTWRMTLSEPVDVDLHADLAFLPVGGGAELSTLDVDPRWLDSGFHAEPRPERPLSEVTRSEGLRVTVPAGERSVDVRVPTLKGAAQQPEKSLKVRLSVLDSASVPRPGPVVTGTVSEAP